MKRISILLSLLMTCSVALASCANPGKESGNSPSSTIEESESARNSDTASQSGKIKTPNGLSESPNDDEYLFTIETFPKVDGSTANLPLIATALARTTGIDEVEAQSFVSVTKTNNAYIRLASGDVDIVIAYEPSEGNREYVQSIAEIEYHAIGRDALVFLVNEDNPVNSLTVEQLQGIFEGKIKNWNEVGGGSLPIAAFQREEDSGSQALFIKHLMKDKELADPTMEIKTDMWDLVNTVASYNNEPRAIGYSVYYYANTMLEVPGIKFLEIDGVEVSDRTIASEAYPFVNDFYAAVRADEPENSPARQLLAWLKSDEGKQCISDTGYVSIK